MGLVAVSRVKSILKLYLCKSIVTDGKATRSKVESIDLKKHFKVKKQLFENYSSKSIAFSNVKVSTSPLPMMTCFEGGKMVNQKKLLPPRRPSE